MSVTKTPKNPKLHIFGIRHHGPGSARSLQAALRKLKPDCLLIEGDPQLEEVLPLAISSEMKPPVAALLYNPKDLQQAVFYPMADFSPEWQAILYGLKAKIPVRFMDLPQAHRLARQEQKEALLQQKKEVETEEGVDSEAEKEEEVEVENEMEKDLEFTEKEGAKFGEKSEQKIKISQDPLSYVAKITGDGDGERWWERLVEEQRDGENIFAEIMELMGLLRQEMEEIRKGEKQERGEEIGVKEKLKQEEEEREEFEKEEESLREAFMRQIVRKAMKEGFQKIAVVCGAWHAPALDLEKGEKTQEKEIKNLSDNLILPKEKEDQKMLENLPRKVELKATWVPWSYERLSRNSGYGAGVNSPGWYDHLWRFPTQTNSKWLTRIAHLLRKEGLDCSTAQIIEAVRLSESLAYLRGLQAPGLPELMESWQATFTFGGSNIYLKLIEKKLLIDDRLGQIPLETPQIPLQQDIQFWQKKLRLPPEVFAKEYDLDLRKNLDLQRSHFLHRLAIIGLNWGQIVTNKKQTGTFHEWWTLSWQPEFSLKIIDASQYGQTILGAAENFIGETLQKEETTLADLARILDQALLADLPRSFDNLLLALENKSAVSTDLIELLGAVSPLVHLSRYGSVRGRKEQLLKGVLDSLVVRVCVGLPGLCLNLDEESSTLLLAKIRDCHFSLQILSRSDLQQLWQKTLLQIADLQTSSSLLIGFAVRLLLDSGFFPSSEAARRLGLALSLANNSAWAANWLEGFLEGKGVVLLQDEDLWQIFNTWLQTLEEENFQNLLPLLRRTFSKYEVSEKRYLGQKAKQNLTLQANLQNNQQNEKPPQTEGETEENGESSQTLQNQENQNTDILDTLADLLNF